MKIILVYDIALEEPKDQNRLNKIRKIARKYINHVQKSVFEGNITESKLERLKKEIMNVIDKDRDSVIIYVFEDSFYYKRYILTNTPDPTDNLI